MKMFWKGLMVGVVVTNVAWVVWDKKFDREYTNVVVSVVKEDVECRAAGGKLSVYGGYAGNVVIECHKPSEVISRIAL